MEAKIKKSGGKIQKSNFRVQKTKRAQFDHLGEIHLLISIFLNFFSVFDIFDYCITDHQKMAHFLSLNLESFATVFD